MYVFPVLEQFSAEFLDVIELTQTDTAPGNCVQTCIACILEVDPNALPDQTKYDRYEDYLGGMRVYPHPRRYYTQALDAYLAKHHALSLVRIGLDASIASKVLQVREPGWHLISGNTVRTAATRNRHVVVARYGKIVWDPHPSRAGLLPEGRIWVVLAPCAELSACSCECPACS